jgi:hypothetical protein
MWFISIQTRTIKYIYISALTCEKYERSVINFLDSLVGLFNSIAATIEVVYCWLRTEDIHLIIVDG